MWAPRGAAATSKAIRTSGDGHSENCEGQVRRFGGFMAFFCPQCIPLVESQPVHC